MTQLNLTKYTRITDNKSEIWFHCQDARKIVQICNVKAYAFILPNTRMYSKPPRKVANCVCSNTDMIKLSNCIHCHGCQKIFMCVNETRDRTHRDKSLLFISTLLAVGLYP